MFKQNCPLCERMASFEARDFGRRKAFLCEHCAEYIISNAAEARIQSAPTDWKDKLSARAKAAPNGKVLLITLPAASTQTGLATEEFHLEYVPR